MIYILLITLIVLFFLSYLFSGKDFFAPATVQILTFAGSAFLCIYFMLSMDAPHSFHWNTIIMVICSMTLSMVIGVAVHRIYARVEITPQDRDSEKISPISNFVNIFVIGFIIITILWTLIEVKRIGGSSGSFNAIMHSYRMNSSYSADLEDKFPWLLGQMLTLMRILFFFYTYDIIRFSKELSLKRKLVDIIIIVLCSVGLLLCAIRNQLVVQIVASLIMFHLLRIQKNNGYKKYNIKQMFKGISVFVMIFLLFFVTKTFVGRDSRNEDLNIADYISYYAGTEYITLDTYMQNPSPANDILGKETFYYLNQFLASRGLSESPLYIRHLEFRSVGAGYRSNTYTFLRAYHHDFGMMGVYILHSVSIVFMSVFYEHVKKRRGTLSILIFAEMYYCIMLSFFQEYTFAEIVSPKFFKMIIMLILLYEVLIRKRIKLVFRRREYFHTPKQLNRTDINF